VPWFVETSRSLAERSYRLDIQGLRAIAVLTVVAFHAGLPVPGGFVGVDMFFVISGFVITAMLQTEWGVTGRINFGRFYIRRFKRLIPALAVLVTITVAISVLVLSPFGSQQTTAKTAVGAMFFVANIIIAKTTGGYFEAPAETNPLLNIWSLSVEEQFYLAFPSILAVGWLLREKNRLFPFLIVGSFVAASFLLALLGSAHPQASLLLGFYSPITRAWEFGLGALLFLSVARRSIVSRNLATALGLLGAFILGASLWCVTRATPFPGVWTLLPVTGTILLILAGSHQSNAVTRALAARPMVKVGDWSYSIYLWHWPLIVFATLIWPGNLPAVVAGSALSFVPAIASYIWVELPLRNSQELSKPQLMMLVATTLALPLSFALGLWQAARTLFWNETPSIMAARMTLPTGWNDPSCISRIPVSKRDTAQCRWATDATGVPIYLVGDSNAMHFSEALRNAGVMLHRPVTALGADGCPLIDVFLWRKSDPSLTIECREDYIAMMNWLTTEPPGLVMIGSVDRYWRDTEDYRVSPDGRSTNVDPNLNADALNAGLQRTVKRLQKAGHAVLLLQTIPHYVFEPYSMAACTGWDVLNGLCQPTLEMPVEIANKWQEKSRYGIAYVAAATGAAVFDFRNYFCPQAKCLTKINGVNHYMPDGYHLNKNGSAQLTDTFISAIKTDDTRVSTK
jgi:peptidoglycan/LPS O-acetylase OafA/YrhL